MELRDFREPTEVHDRAIQMALREVEVDVMVDFLSGMEQQDREIIFRNMSERASVLLKDDLESKASSVPAQRFQDAKVFFLQLLSRFYNYADSNAGVSVPEGPPRIDDSTHVALVESLISTAHFVRVRGLLALHGSDSEIVNPIARKGIQMAVDGWDGMERNVVLERLRETYLEKISKSIDIIIEGCDLIAGDDHMVVVAERLRAFLPDSE